MLESLPCQLCASRTWKGTTTFPDRSPMVLKAFGKKSRRGQSMPAKNQIMPKQSILDFLLVQQEATEESVIMWAKRVMSDYNRKAAKNASAKQKVGLVGARLGSKFKSNIFQIMLVYMAIINHPPNPHKWFVETIKHGWFINIPTLQCFKCKIL